jgi:predicted MFS family arabinose efflux permease
LPRDLGAPGLTHGRRLGAYFARLGRFPRNARLYLAGTFLMGMGQGAQWVHLNLYFRSLGLHEAAIGRILSMGAFGTVLIALPAALWIDRIPAQRVFGTAAIGFGLLFGTQLLVDRPSVLALAALGSGMLFTIHWVAAAPFFMRNAPEEDRIYLFGFANATETMATVVAAAAGGAAIRYLAARSGSELLGLRYALLLIAGTSLLAGFFFLRIRDVPPAGERRSLRHYLVARDVRLLGQLTLPNFLVGLGAGLIIPFLNLYFRDRFGQDPRQIGGFYAVSQFLTMLGFLAGAPLARRVGSVRTIVLTELLSIPFFCILAFTRDLPLAVLAFWMRGALMNMNGPVSSNFAMEVVPADQRTVTNSVRMLAWNGSWMVSTQIGGWIIQRHGYTPPMLVTIGLYAVSAAVFYGFFRDHGLVGRGRAA